MTPFEVRKLVSRLAAAFPDPPISDETRKEYCRMLVDLPYPETDRAIEELEATWGKLPTIYRIRDAVITPMLDLPSADEAWDQVQRRKPDRHELVTKVVNLFGGDYNIRTSDDPELTRTRFTRTYEEHRRKTASQALTATLRGQRMQQAS